MIQRMSDYSPCSLNQMEECSPNLSRPNFESLKTPLWSGFLLTSPLLAWGEFRIQERRMHGPAIAANPQLLNRNLRSSNVLSNGELVSFFVKST